LSGPRPMGSLWEMLQSHLPNLITVFLGIFLEASPFLLVGILISSALEVLVTPERLARWFPRNALLGLVGGVALGAAAPLCECGTVPIARGSVSKGLPLPAAIGFLLAAPVINPITVAATYTAFQSDTRVVVLRIVLGVVIALAVGGLFLLWPESVSPLRGERPPSPPSPLSLKGRGGDSQGRSAVRAAGGPAQDRSLRPRAFEVVTPLPPEGEGLGVRGEHHHLTAILHHTADELTSLMIYLVGASALAALLQVFLPRQQLLSVGQGPLLSVLVMMAVAVVLSTCSSVDAFVALAFSTTFAPGAILAFLLISPVLNLKSGALVIGLFRPRVAASLLAAATATVLLAALTVNYHLL